MKATIHRNARQTHPPSAHRGTLTKIILLASAVSEQYIHGSAISKLIFLAHSYPFDSVQLLFFKFLLTSLKLEF